MEEANLLEAKLVPFHTTTMMSISEFITTEMATSNYNITDFILASSTEPEINNFYFYEQQQQQQQQIQVGLLPFPSNTPIGFTEDEHEDKHREETRVTRLTRRMTGEGFWALLAATTLKQD
ncbi:hypothetical protein LSTR_LSTR012512 [Laodelphax striatellus]|uniref:Uncharacterized protein n=1 Tax=Laodelphax striatellus TaxID=195883 RepID=A0A482XL86_LAOST|nr:hypothetical protein LSTR_LSTR012512 [Laodelphax striatellus]